MNQRDSTQKVAIIEPSDIDLFLNSATSLTNQVRTFSLVAFGLHPENLRNFNKDSIRLADVSMIIYSRAKNLKPMNQPLPRNQAEQILKCIKQGAFNICNRQYEYICEQQGMALKSYQTPPVSPWTLRHTFITNVLKEYLHRPDYIELTAVRAGCDPKIVMHNYLIFNQWEKITDSVGTWDSTKFKFNLDL